MLRRAIVHIGPMKTGSSSIQEWLVQKANFLEQSGVHVVRSLSPNMSRLAAIVFAQLLDKPPVPSDEERMQRMDAEIRALPDSVHTLVFSGEMMGHQLHRPGEVRRLKAILDQYCDSYRIVAYLRRQDELSVSLYSTVLRRGERAARRLNRPLDYDAMLTAWSRVFGREAIVPRLFDRTSLTGGDVVRDFAEAAGLPFEPGVAATMRQNPSLRPEAQAFLLDLANRARAGGMEGPLIQFGRMEDVNEVLNAAYVGKGGMPSRAEAQAFYESARAANEAVRQAWFPDRATLFDEDFSSYPEVAPAPPSAEERLEVAMTVLVRMITGQQDRTGPDEDAKARGALSAEMRRQRRRREQEQAGRRAGR